MQLADVRGDGEGHPGREALYVTRDSGQRFTGNQRQRGRCHLPRFLRGVACLGFSYHCHNGKNSLTRIRGRQGNGMQRQRQSILALRLWLSASLRRLPCPAPASINDDG